MAEVKKLTLRFNLENQRHAKIIRRLESLNMSIYKSKTEFIMRAIEHYIECLDADNLDVPKHDIVTTEILRSEMENLKKDIKLEIYEEILHMNGMVGFQEVQPDEVGSKRKPSTTQDAIPSNVDLTQFDDIMNDIEAWSSN